MSREARAVAVLALLALVVTPAIPAVAAQADGNRTAGPGPFTLDQLRSSGTHPSAAPESVRYLGASGSPGGSAALRYDSADPLGGTNQFLAPGTTLNTNRLQLYTTVFGNATGSYEFVVVYWHQEQREIGNQTVTVAADQQVQRVSVNIGPGYQTTQISLFPHYGEEWQATAWLERDGERVEGAQWRFTHASVRSSQAVQIATVSDAWSYSLRTAILPGIAAIVIGLTGSRLVLRKTGRGPGLGMAVWAFVGGVGLLVAATSLWYEIAEVVARLDMLLGLSLGIVAFGGGLQMHDEPEKVRFLRKELTEGTSLRNGGREQTAVDTEGDESDGDTDETDVVEIPDEEYKDELFEESTTLPTLRRGGERVIIKSGIRPFLGRLFGKPAILDLSDLRTRVKVKSDSVAEKVFTSPAADEAVEHKSATLSREWPVWRRVKDTDLSIPERILFGTLTLVVLTLPISGWYLADSMANVPLVGFALGLVVLLVESHTVEDGEVSVEPAPRHFVSADASLTILQQEFADAKTLEAFEEIAWKERASTALEARAIDSRRDKGVMQEIIEDDLGMPIDMLDGPSVEMGGPEPSADDGVDDQQDARADGGEDADE